MAPGGWINSSSVQRNVNCEKLRFKSFFECCDEFGLNFVNVNLRISYDLLPILGKKFDDNVKYVNESFQYRNKNIPKIYITDKPLAEEKKENYDIQIISKEELEEDIEGMNTDSIASMFKTFNKIYGVSIKKIDKNFSGDIYRVIRNIQDNNGITLKEGSKISAAYLKLVKLS